MSYLHILDFNGFQSTPSARRATRRREPRARGHIYFNPRPPRGGRRAARDFDKSANVFQSTPSARRATNAVMLIVITVSISIHALREEGDPSSAVKSMLKYSFQSTPSARRATLFTERIVAIL